MGSRASTAPTRGTGKCGLPPSSRVGGTSSFAEASADRMADRKAPHYGCRFSKWEVTLPSPANHASALNFFRTFPPQRNPG